MVNKKNNSPFSILNSQLILLLLFAASCHSPHNNDYRQIPNPVVKDTVFASPLDSLVWVIETGTEEQIMEALSGLDKYRSSNPELVFKYAKDLYFMYAKSSNVILQGKITSTLGGIYYESGKIDSALIYFNESVSFFEKSNDEESLAINRMRLSLTQNHALEYEKVINNLLKALDY